MATTVLDSDTFAGMAKKKEKTVSIHARVVESDAAEIKKSADNQPIPVSTSYMVAMIIREWANRQRSPKKK